MNKQFLILLLLLRYTPTNAQTFYVTCPIDGINPGNKSFQLNTSNCDSLRIFVCPPTQDTLQYPARQYLDIAMDKQQNLYYVSSYVGHLYRRSLNDTASCQYLGSFKYPPNALVVDSDNIIYAASNGNANGCWLFRYNISSGIFDTAGVVTGFASAGDLFFYEHRLFLTGSNSGGSASYLVEVDIDDPSQSCYYMGLQNLQPWSAFSVNYGSYSKAYILSTDFPSNQPNQYPIGSSLIEIDIEHKTIGAPICSYPFWAGGAAAYYNLTASSSSCSTSGIEKNKRDELKIFPNPFSGQLTFSLADNTRATVSLYNFLDQQVLQQTFSNFTTINTEQFASGIYFYEVSNSKETLKTGKVVKQ